MPDQAEEPTGGVAQDPPAAVTESAASMLNPSDETDARVIASLGEHLAPAEGESQTPSAPATEEPKPPTEEPKAPEQAPKPDANQPEKKEESETPSMPVPQPEKPRTSKLDKRVATLFIRNLALSGETEIPSIDEVLTQLSSHSMEDKIKALNFHLGKNKELRGLKSDELTGEEAEDREAVRDAERESIRAEVRQEEAERNAKAAFVTFMEAHPELDETKPEGFNSVLAAAVETLWKNGLPIDQAYATVTAQIKAVEKSQQDAAQRTKEAELSGVTTASTTATPQSGEITWEEMARLQQSDPAEWTRRIVSGEVPKN